jgi:hypothetical protein
MCAQQVNQVTHRGTLVAAIKPRPEFTLDLPIPTTTTTTSTLTVVTTTMAEGIRINNPYLNMLHCAVDEAVARLRGIPTSQRGYNLWSGNSDEELADTLLKFHKTARGLSESLLKQRAEHSVREREESDRFKAFLSDIEQRIAFAEQDHEEVRSSSD